jgi:hypothetical protein
MEHDLQKAVNMKLILCIFEELSGLKINFHKSEIFSLEMQRFRLSNIRIFLGVRPVLYPLIFGNTDPS